MNVLVIGGYTVFGTLPSLPLWLMSGTGAVIAINLFILGGIWGYFARKMKSNYIQNSNQREKRAVQELKSWYNAIAQDENAMPEKRKYHQKMLNLLNLRTFECVICHELMSYPFLCSDGHNFCHSCIM